MWILVVCVCWYRFFIGNYVDPHPTTSLSETMSRNRKAMLQHVAILRNREFYSVGTELALSFQMVNSEKSTAVYEFRRMFAPLQYATAKELELKDLTNLVITGNRACFEIGMYKDYQATYAYY